MTDDVTRAGQLVDQIEELIDRYIVFPQSFYNFPITLWAIATYYIREFESFGYLQFCSVHGGLAKTILFELLKRIVSNGEMADDTTVSSMLTLIEQGYETIFFDQCEKFFNRDSDKLRSAILSGTRRDATVSVRQGKGVSVRSPYCAKAFALVGRELGGTLNDRCCIIVWMRPGTPKVSHNETSFKEYALEIGNVCAVVARKFLDEIRTAIKTYRNIEFLNGRENEVWKPVVCVCEVFCPHRRNELLQAIADIKGTKRLEHKVISEKEAERLQRLVEDSNQLKRDMLLLIGDGYGILSGELLPALLAMPQRIWGRYEETGLTQAQLNDLLKAAGIAPRQSRHFMSDGKPRRGYVRSDVEASLNSPKQAGTPVQALSNKVGGDG